MHIYIYIYVYIYIYLSGKITDSEGSQNSEGHVNTWDTHTSLYAFMQNFMIFQMVKSDFGLAVNFARYEVRKFDPCTKYLCLVVENMRNRQISMRAFQRYFQNIFSSPLH